MRISHKITKSRFSYLFVLALCVPGMVVGTAAALPSDDIDAIYRDSVHYASTPPSQCNPDGSNGGSDIPLVGSDNAERTYNFLVSSELTPEQAAGVMGNLAVESGFIPNNQENSQTWPNGGWGIAQWTGGRRITLRDAVQAAGLPYTDSESDKLSAQDNDALLLFQLNFLVEESKKRTMRDNPNSKEWDGLKETKDVEEATTYWEYNFERAGVPRLDVRIELANDFLNRYGSNTTTGVSGGACGTEGGGGEIVGGFSLPTDQKWFDQHKNWFTKPHHDYPAADIPIPDGTKVYSMTAGKIIKAPIQENNTSYGQGVMIEASDGTIFIYGHGSDGGSIPGAKEGDQVRAGQLIMHSSYTGNVIPPGKDGAHLHLEIRPPGGSFADVLCPQKLLEAIGEKNPEIPKISDLPNRGCTN